MDALNALFTVATGSTEPIYRQLVEQIRRRVVAGQWAPGQPMPSVRELAEALAVNPMTVSKAFGQLESQGVLERRRGLSMVVAAQAGRATAADRAALLRPTLEQAAGESRQLALSDSRALALFKSVLQETKPTDEE
ncbi:MAG TPA: GntR family transcriptional regulator [Caldimonas sp.]|nr:GntR family transcriptional regulator [Caldimonas sp.]